MSNRFGSKPVFSILSRFSLKFGWIVPALGLVPLALISQVTKDVVPLKDWPAPPHWYPAVALPTSSTEATGPLAVAPTGLDFVAMPLCRVVDTRAQYMFLAPFGAPGLTPGPARSFPLQSSTVCSIPSTAQAYSLNVTVVPPGSLGYLIMWPTGQTQPDIVTIDDVPGDIRNNAIILPAGTPNGSVSAVVNGNTDLVIDINGYYALPTGGSTGATGPTGSTGSTGPNRRHGFARPHGRHRRHGFARSHGRHGRDGFARSHGRHRRHGLARSHGRHRRHRLARSHGFHGNHGSHGFDWLDRCYGPNWTIHGQLRLRRHLQSRQATGARQQRGCRGSQQCVEQQPDWNCRDCLRKLVRGSNGCCHYLRHRYLPVRQQFRDHCRGLCPG